MPDVGFDTSSYPKASLPVQQTPLQIAGQLGAIQQQKLSIDQAKLDQANQGLAYLARAMSSLGPNATEAQYRQAGDQITRQLGLDPSKTAIWNEQVDAAKRPDGTFDSQGFFNHVINSANNNQQILQNYKGAPSTTTDNANIYAGVTGGMSGPNPGGFTPANSAPLQIPPSAPIQNAQGKPGFVGAPPAGWRPAGAGLPVQPQTAVAPPPSAANPRRLPVATTGPTGPTVDITPKTPTNFDNRFNAAFPNAVASGPAPGTVEAAQAVGSQSGKDFATDLTRAGSINAELQPDLAVLNIVKNKAPGDFGPGTDSLNQLKKIAVTWLPNVDPKVINSSSDYDTVKKYLVQGARAAGNTGTNDQLAAAFEANPNTTMNTATIENIVKSRVALKKMDAAQTLMFSQQKNKDGEPLPESQYSKWKAQNQNVLDPRAFGFDLMSPEAKVKLMDTLATKDKSGNFIAKKGKEKEFNKFESSLSFANDAGLIAPPGRQ